MTEESAPKRKIRYIIGFECIAQKYNPNTGYIFGKIWNLECYGKFNEFRGSIDFLAERTGLSYATVLRIIKILLRDNLIIDTTPENKRSDRMQVRHYIVNQSNLLKLSIEMDLYTDDNLNNIKLNNESKKKFLRESSVTKEKENLIEIMPDNIEIYNPFDDPEDELTE